mmetsp:Transcript_11605/g.13987  ORF Transcript_11605/g.13987 Transcript_11605/m.13987 type:complete len:184 (+) Transcript_11605:89-640(+)
MKSFFRSTAAPIISRNVHNSTMSLGHRPGVVSSLSSSFFSTMGKKVESKRTIDELHVTTIDESSYLHNIEPIPSQEKKSHCIKMIASHNYKKGDIIFQQTSNLKITSQKSLHSIQLSANKYINIFKNAFLEHSLHPNLIANFCNKGNGVQFIVLKDILKGENLTFNYLTTNDVIGEFNSASYH